MRRERLAVDFPVRRDAGEVRDPGVRVVEDELAAHGDGFRGRANVRSLAKRQERGREPSKRVEIEPTLRRGIASELHEFRLERPRRLFHVDVLEQAKLREREGEGLRVDATDAGLVVRVEFRAPRANDLLRNVRGRRRRRRGRGRRGRRPRGGVDAIAEVGVDGGAEIRGSDAARGASEVGVDGGSEIRGSDAARGASSAASSSGDVSKASSSTSA